MKVSGKAVAEAILRKLDQKIKEKKLQPGLAIILANNFEASRIYVQNKLRVAQRIGIKVQLFEFTKNQQDKVLETIKRLNTDSKVHGIIFQYPAFEGWDFGKLEKTIDLQKDVDGFLENSPYSGATALAVWEMLTAFALLEGFKKTEQFLQGKKIVLVGKGKAAGGPTFKLLQEKGFNPEVVVKETSNPDSIIKKGDVVISATGAKNIINKTNLKPDTFIVGVGSGDLNEGEVSKVAKLYNPNIGGIGPLTIVSLLENVVKSAGRNK